jgi:hypothetical protein
MGSEDPHVRTLCLRLVHRELDAGSNDRLVRVRRKLLRVIAVLRRRLPSDESGHATPQPRRGAAVVLKGTKSGKSRPSAA